MKPILAISVGDFNGIGPEVILKTLFFINDLPFTPLILGHPVILDFYSGLVPGKLKYHIAETPSHIKSDDINVLPVETLSLEDIRPGKITTKAGAFAMKAIEAGIKFCQDGVAGALVTAPISKKAIHQAGYSIPGHTEYLALKTHCKDYVMMLVSKMLRIGLVTTHIPLQDVKRSVTKSSILKHLYVLDNSLRSDFGIKKPHIAVLGLNPHAGDGGIIGSEEVEIISPAINEAKNYGITVNGPFPADGFFGNRTYEHYDAVLAMYHDQGLIPFKSLSFNEGVNFTAGLPILRTSPDHGTAFDIAGQGKASYQSFHEALMLALHLHRQRFVTITTQSAK